ncbi:DUF6299 family protein [Kitasatospora sp. NPDC052868]|uniref:DUF6299 family protein n=1 Tax=Kitasatospora sp. NPDC052868 TaxID=3364060 RepID=UPI0037C968B0
MRRSVSAALSTAVSVTLLSGFWAASPAQAATSGTTPANFTGTVSLDPAGTVDGNAIVTLSGTYRCTGPKSYAVVNSSVQGMVAIGASAICDGADHTWVSRGRPNPGPLVKVGPAQVVTSLQLWETAPSGWPRLVTFATDQKIVDLRAAAN